jgi:transcription antitermination protein NusB
VTGPARGGRRREARERALELAYEAEVRDIGLDELLASLVVPPDDYTVALLRAADEHRTAAEDRIAARSRGWTLARMPLLDRLIMRLAVAELMTQPDVPTAVVLAEATDLAGQFSTDDSSRFVNGVLAAIGRELRPAP